MVQIVIMTDHGAALCRFTIDSTATVAQLLDQVFALQPELRSTTRLIRNDARGTLFLLDGPNSSFREHSLRSAKLATSESTLETLVFSRYSSLSATESSTPQVNNCSDEMHRSSNNSSSWPPRSPEAIRARLLELFGEGAGDPHARGRASTTSQRQLQEERQRRVADASDSPATATHTTATTTTTATNTATTNTTTTTESATVNEAELMDPAQVEMQRRIYEDIMQRQIDENLANAYEYTPEVFTHVTMLYVPCIINQVPLKAFVDSGAQKSVISLRTAERCNLMRLLDRRMAGVAVGVGQQVILGQIHMTTVKIASLYLPFAFSVLAEQPMDVIIGLDQLKRHLMTIDLKHNYLVIGDTQVPFLPENEVSADSDHNQHNSDNASNSSAMGTGVNASAALPPPPPPQQQQQQRRLSQPNTPAASSTSASPTAFPVAGAAESSAPVSASSAAPLTEREKATRVEDFMAFTGIVSRPQARELLEAAGWDADAAASRYFEVD
ncbi:Dna-damage inducible protein DDI1-like protein [Lotmaria passim]